MNSYEIESEITDRVNATNYDISDILAVIDLTVSDQLLTSLGV